MNDRDYILVQAVQIGTRIRKGQRQFEYLGQRASQGRYKFAELRDEVSDSSEPQVIRIRPSTVVERVAP